MRLLVSVLAVLAVNGASWTYHDDHGPSRWHSLEGNEACGSEASTERQSPIDISEAVFHRGNLQMNYTSLANLSLTNTGHGLQVNYPTDGSPQTLFGSHLVGATNYHLAQFHLHWAAENKRGSEHYLKGQQYPLEMHLVHYSDQYESLGEAASEDLAVVGVMFQVGQHNDELQKILDQIFEVLPKGASAIVSESLDMKALLPQDVATHFYSYHGSLTTPPCYESVHWNLLASVQELSQSQLNLIRLAMHDDLEAESNAPIGFNFRPLQPLNARKVHCSFSGCEFSGTTAYARVTHDPKEAVSSAPASGVPVNAVVGIAFGTAAVVTILCFIFFYFWQKGQSRVEPTG